MKLPIPALIALIATAGITLPAAAQDAPPAAQPPDSQPAVDAPPVDPEIDAFINRLVGSYQGAEHRLHIVEVESPPFERPLYVELARRGFETTPDRQQLWWIYRHEGQLRIRVNILPERQRYLFGASLPDLAVGLWAAPEYFPRLAADMYDALGDLTIDDRAGALRLVSPSPLPIQFGGAMFTEVDLTIDESQFVWMETGRDSAGEVAWGDESITMQRLAETPRAVELGGGVRMIVLREGVGPAVDDGCKVALHYEGWLTNGMLIDSTLIEGKQIYTGNYPLNTMPGMNVGIRGMKAPESPKDFPPHSGEVRRILVPPSMALGDRGAPPIIPPGSPVIFNLELRSVLTNPQASDGAQGPQPPQQP